MPNSKVCMRCLFSSCLFLALACSAFAPQAEAGFIGSYQTNLFTLTNSNSLGSASSPDGGQSLVITGPNTGDGFAGTTDFTLILPSSGTILFQYTYASLDDPGLDFAGYLLGGVFVQFADTNGQSGSLAIPVNQGTLFGFRVGSLDNQGEAGVLTISNFSGPQASTVPEPSSFGLMLVAAAAMVCRSCKAVRQS